MVYRVPGWERLLLGKTRAAGPEGSVLSVTAGNLGLNLANRALNFLVSLILARLLGAAGYGTFAYALAWAGLLGVPAMLGLSPLLVRDIAVYRSRGQWALIRGILRRSDQAVLAVSLCLVAVAGVGGLLLIPSSQPTMQTVYWLGLLLVPIAALTSLRQAAMQAFSRVVLGRLPEMLVLPLLFMTLIAGAAVLRGGELSPVWVVSLYVTAAVLAFLLGSRLLWRSVPPEVKSAVPTYDTRVWARSAVPLLLLSGIGSVNAQTALVLLGAMKGPETVGLFSAASRGAMFVNFFFVAATYPLAPLLARLHAAGDVERLQRLLTRSARVLLLCSFPVAFVLSVFGHRLLSLFGAEFVGARASLVILCVAELLSVAAGLNGLTLIMSGNERDAAWGMGVGALLNVLFNVLLIPGWGLEGAAAATAGSRAFSQVLLVWLLWHRLRLYSPALGAGRARRLTRPVRAARG